MGVVWLAFDERLNRHVVLKTLETAGAEMRKRLEREAQAQARLREDKVVTVYELVEADGALFIVMEYVDGQTLAEMLRARPPMARAEAMEIFGQILDALDYVHGHGVVHRDVKPSNVMLSRGRVKLMDFGIALMADLPHQTKTLFGTPQYMSPEQFESSAVDHRSDIYSAAIVLFEMLSGRLPFEEKAWMAAMQARLLPPPELKNLVPDLPAGMSDAVAIALRREPAQRFESVAKFKTALLEGMSGFLPAAPERAEDEITTVRLPDAPPPAEPEPKAQESEPAHSTTLLWIVSLTVVVLSVIASVPLFLKRSSPAVPPPVRAAVQTQTVFVPLPPTQTIAPVPQPAAPKEPEKLYPFRGEQPTAAKEEDDARAREIERLRAAIEEAFQRAESFLAAEKFEAVQQELDFVAEAVQRYPTDLWQQGDAARRLTKRLNDARVAAQTRAMQEAMLEAKLTQIQQRIDANRFPEAEALAEEVINDPHAPERIAARARELLQKAKERFSEMFKDAPMGETKNKIRKPSSPPRN